MCAVRRLEGREIPRALRDEPFVVAHVQIESRTTRPTRELLR